MKKKFLIVLAIASMSFSLAGCCLSHNWEEATCDASKMCSKCGKIEGEPLGHEEGTAANYQSGPLCSRCGAEIGERIPDEFTAKGLTLASSGETVSYTTVTQNGYETVGEVALYTGDTTIAGPNGECIDGYEWVHATLYLSFFDESAKNDGVKWHNTVEDFYTVDAFDNSLTVVREDEAAMLVVKQFCVNYLGEEYDRCTVTSQFMNNGWGEDEVYTAAYDYYFCVPQGYDGMIVGVYNGANNWEDGQHIYDVAGDGAVFFKVK